MKLIATTASIAAALLITGPLGAARAQDAAGDGDRTVSLGIGIPDSIDFQGSVGVAAGVVPDYGGSNDYAAAALPLIDIRQPGFLFIEGASVNPNDGLATVGWNALNFTYAAGSEEKFRLSLGPLARYSGGRDQEDNDALNGLGDIDGSVGAGGFLEASAGPWSADVTIVSQDAGDGGDGILVAFGAQYTARVNDGFIVSTGISSSWADDDYMQGFYGVTSGQAAGSGLAPFDADSGLKDVGVQLGASYEMAENWLVSGQVGYQRLLNDAADSPLVDDAGSPHQFRALLGVAYRF